MYWRVKLKNVKIVDFLILLIGGYWGYRLMRKEFLTNNNHEIEILARTVYGEARGEVPAGQKAVMATILNRVRKGGWWGATIEDVCLKPYQFSCWNPKTVGTTDKSEIANYNQMIHVTMEDELYAYIYQLAKTAVTDNGGYLINDLSNGATHYHAVGANPYWAKEMTKTAQIGNHIFYK